MPFYCVQELCAYLSPGTTYLFKTIVNKIKHLVMSALCTSDWCLGASFFLIFKFPAVDRVGCGICNYTGRTGTFPNKCAYYVFLPSVSLQVAAWNEVCQG